MSVFCPIDTEKSTSTMANRSLRRMSAAKRFVVRTCQTIPTTSQTTNKLREPRMGHGGIAVSSVLFGNWEGIHFRFSMDATARRCVSPSVPRNEIRVQTDLGPHVLRSVDNSPGENTNIIREMTDAFGIHGSTDHRIEMDHFVSRVDRPGFS